MERESGMRAKVWSPDLNLAAPSGRPGGRRWTTGRGRGPLNFSWTRVPAAAAGRPGLGRSGEPSSGGEGFKETKARAGRRWGLCADTCISRLWAFVGLSLGTCICLRFCVPAALRDCFALVPTFCGPALGSGCCWAHRCAFAYKVCACRRVWFGCRWSMCAESQTPPPTPHSPAVHPGPRLGFKLFSGFLGQQPRPPLR